MSKYIIFFIIPLLFFIRSAGAEETLTWQDCVKEAQKNHPDLISAEENIKELEAGRKITASGLFPQVDSSAGASTSETRAGGTGETSDSFSYGVSGSQLLFDGFKTRDNVRASSENIKAAQYNYRFISSEVRQRLRTAFINLLKNQELLKITEEIRKIRIDNLELINLRHESGIEHRGALLTAEANLAQAELEIAQAKRALEVAQRELVKEMGRTQFLPVQAEGDFTVTGITPEKPDFETLINDHPAFRRLTAQKNAASYGIKTAEADFFPELSAQAGADRSSSHWEMQDETDRLTAGITLSFPLFEGGLRLAEVAQAKAQFNQAQADERSGKDGIIVALEQSWADFKDAVEAVDVQKKFLDAAEERAKIAGSQYSLGLIEFDNWTIIEDNLVRAKKAFLDARANALLAEAGWVQAKGETLEYAD